MTRFIIPAIAILAIVSLADAQPMVPSGGGGGGGGSSTITANSTATSGCSANTVLYSDGSKVQCSATLPYALAVTPTQAANTSVDGYVLADPTAATVNNQQSSPRLRLTGQGWKTTATAGSETVDWIIENQPVQGTAVPSTLLAFSAQINSAGYNPIVNFNSLSSVSRPAMYFGTDNSTGIWAVTSGNLSVSVAAVEKLRINANGLNAPGTLLFGGSVSVPNIEFASSASGVLGLVSITTTNPTAFYAYNTTDSDINPANYERGAFDWKTTSNVLTIGTQALGTGTVRGLQIVTGGTNAITVSGSQLVALPAITSDAALTDATMCEDTTLHGLHSGSGTLGICLGTSGRQFKNIVGDISIGLREILALPMHDYFYLPGWGDGGARIQYGPTAQDVEAVPGLAHLAGHDASGATINYDSGALLMASVHAIQELKAGNDNLRAEIDALRRSISR